MKKNIKPLMDTRSRYPLSTTPVYWGSGWISEGQRGESNKNITSPQKNQKKKAKESNESIRWLGFPVSRLTNGIKNRTIEKLVSLRGPPSYWPPDSKKTLQSSHPAVYKLHSAPPTVLPPFLSPLYLRPAH